MHAQYIVFMFLCTSSYTMTTQNRPPTPIPPVTSENTALLIRQEPVDGTPTEAQINSMNNSSRPRPPLVVGTEFSQTNTSTAQMKFNIIELQL